MQASFTLTAADFLRLQKVVDRRLRRKPWLSHVLFFMRVLVWFCIGMAGATHVRILRDYPELPGLQVLAYLVAAAILVTVAMPYVSHALLRKHMLDPKGAFLSPQTVQFTDKALVVQAATGRTEVQWAGVLARDADDANYYLFIDAMQALVLPRTAIAPFAIEFEQRIAHLE